MKKYIGIILTFSLAILLAGCGSENLETESPNQEEADEGSRITITDLVGNTIELEQAPKKIIPFSAGDLETIYALGGEAVGRPVMRGEIPEQFAGIPEIGTSNDINIEEVTNLEPDLVIAHPQLNAEQVPVLEQLGIDVLFTGAGSIEEIKTSIQMIGKVLEKEEQAIELIVEIDGKIDTIKENTTEQLRTLIVFGVPGSWMVALPTSLSGSMLEVVGGYNIAKDYPKLERFPQYAQLDTEKIVEANPEVILLITPSSTEKTVETFSKEMEKNPVWQSVDAVKNEKIVSLPNELFGASPGAKISESLDYLQEVLQSMNNTEE